MPEETLRGCRILVVEDEYMLADELRTELTDAEAIVIGPVGAVEAACELVHADPKIDGAILDLNLRGEMVYPVADLLVERGVRFLFTTGYDQAVIPFRFAGIVRCEKPISMHQVIREIGRVVHA